MSTDTFAAMPDAQGFFGPYGGQFVPDHLKAIMDEINASYEEICACPEFQAELASLFPITSVDLTRFSTPSA